MRRLQRYGDDPRRTTNVINVSRIPTSPNSSPISFQPSRLVLHPTSRRTFYFESSTSRVFVSFVSFTRPPLLRGSAFGVGPPDYGVVVPSRSLNELIYTRWGGLRCGGKVGLSKLYSNPSLRSPPPPYRQHALLQTRKPITLTFGPPAGFGPKHTGALECPLESWRASNGWPKSGVFHVRPPPSARTHTHTQKGGVVCVSQYVCVCVSVVFYFIFVLHLKLENDGANGEWQFRRA